MNDDELLDTLMYYLWNVKELRKLMLNDGPEMSVTNICKTLISLDSCNEASSDMGGHLVQWLLTKVDSIASDYDSEYWNSFLPTVQINEDMTGFCEWRKKYGEINPDRTAKILQELIERKKIIDPDGSNVYLRSLDE